MTPETTPKWPWSIALIVSVCAILGFAFGVANLWALGLTPGMRAVTTAAAFAVGTLIFAAAGPTATTAVRKLSDRYTRAETGE